MTREEDAFIEELLGIAKQLERDHAEPLAALVALERVQEIADSESGTKLALAQVAVGFLYAMTRGAGGKRAVAIHRFLQNDPKGHLREFLRKTCSATGAWKSEKTDEIEQAGLPRLLLEGVLFESEGRYLVTRSMRPVVQEAVDPIVFRMATWVERARLEASTDDDPVAYVVGQIGCTRDEARDYLRRFPLK